MSLKRGSLIKVRAFGGKEIVRRFFAKRNATVLICSEEEYESARLEKREPLCVGFPVADVIESTTNNNPSRKSNHGQGPRLKGSLRKINKSKPMAKRKVKGNMRRGIMGRNGGGAI